jgi:tRNA A58 N-methylase Trm61
MNYTEPYIPIPDDVIPVMLKLASVKRDEVVFDLGSGDGRILIAAARDFGAKAIGVEVRRRLVNACRAKLKGLGLSSRVKIRCSNFKKVNMKEADVLALYLSSYTLNLLVPKFTEDLRPGTRIVNFDYPILGWKPVREVEVVPKGWKKPHPLYLYVV